jgi:hypothetical protein
MTIKRHWQFFVATLLLGVAPISAVIAQDQERIATPVYLAQTPSERTYTTARTDGGIDIQITDGNYRVYTTLRPGENAYVGQDGVSVVNLIPSTGHVTVYSAETGETFYDYYIEPVSFDNPLGPETSRSATPTTYVTPQNYDQLAIQITDGNFSFHDILHRTYGNVFEGTDYGYRVIYDRNTGNIRVLGEETGAEVYNYTFSEPSHSYSNSYGDDFSTVPAETYLTRLSDDEYNAELSEGQFYFNGPLYRSSGNVYVGADGRFRVMYDRGNGRIVVINLVTGEEIFNYFYSEVDEGYL